MVVFQILKDFKDKGEEELALEESMLKKTAAARRKAATRNQSGYSVTYPIVECVGPHATNLRTQDSWSEEGG